VPRGHLRALFAEDGQVTLDLHYCLGDHVRREASDERFGSTIRGRLLLLFDERIETRDLLRSCACIASRVLSARSQCDEALLIGDQLVDRLPDAPLKLSRALLVAIAPWRMLLAGAAHQATALGVAGESDIALATWRDHPTGERVDVGRDVGAALGLLEHLLQVEPAPRFEYRRNLHRDWLVLRRLLLRPRVATHERLAPQHLPQLVGVPAARGARARETARPTE
jgi:hypothetical protein